MAYGGSCFSWFAHCQKPQPHNTPSCPPRKPIARLRAQNSADHTLPQPLNTSAPSGRVLQYCSQRQHCPRAHYCVCAPPRSPQHSCMRARGVVPRTKLTPLTDAYRSVVCTYLCAALLWRVLATVLETCSLSELLKGRAIRAVPSIGTASYKTCHRKKRWSRA